MKNVIFGLLVLFFFSCTEEELLVNKNQNYSAKDKVVLTQESNSTSLYKRSVTPYTKSGNDSGCGLEITDIITTGSSCHQDFIRNGVSPSGTSLDGLCTVIPVSYVRSYCLFGDKVENIVIADFNIDYDELLDRCPGLTLPTDPGDLEAFLIDLEREISEIIELDEVNQLFAEFDGGCNFIETPTVVTRVATSCFQFCYLPPQNQGESWTLKKNLCDGDICCFRKRTYCEDGEGELEIVEISQWTTGDECTGSMACDGLTSTLKCEHDCVLTSSLM